MTPEKLDALQRTWEQEDGGGFTTWLTYLQKEQEREQRDTAPPRVLLTVDAQQYTELRASALNVITCWESGDLAAAVRRLGAAL